MALAELDHAARRNTCTDRRRVPRIDDTYHVPSRFCLTDRRTKSSLSRPLVRPYLSVMASSNHPTADEQCDDDDGRQRRLAVVSFSFARVISQALGGLAPPQRTTWTIVDLIPNLIRCRCFDVHPRSSVWIKHQRQTVETPTAMDALFWTPLDNDFTVAILSRWRITSHRCHPHLLPSENLQRSRCIPSESIQLDDAS